MLARAIVRELGPRAARQEEIAGSKQQWHGVAGAMGQVVPVPAPGSRWQRVRRRTLVPVESRRCRGQKGTVDPEQRAERGGKSS